MNGSTGTRPAPERCWIDTPAGPVFAVHHRARAAVAQGRGVVPCNPFGLEALSGLDPAKGEGATVKRALVVARDDLPGGEGALVAKLEARGAEVTLSRSHGYRALMPDDAYKSIVPEHVWDEIVAWLSEPGPA